MAINGLKSPDVFFRVFREVNEFSQGARSETKIVSWRPSRKS